MAPVAVPMPQRTPVALAPVEPVTALAATPEREVLRCEHCKLVQFRTSSDSCRRCKKSLLPDLPKPQAVVAMPSAPAVPNKGGELQVATAVRDLRRVRNLSQRQLAARMNVPRTYISKIENGKAMPTLNSLDRLARALNVELSALLRDAPTRHKDETAMLMADPFLAELAKFAPHLNATQKSIFLNHVRELAQGRMRRTA